jgi:putative transposase
MVISGQTGRRDVRERRAEARQTRMAPGSARGPVGSRKERRPRRRPLHRPRYHRAEGFRTADVAMHTYCSIHIHVVFATWDRCRFLSHSFRRDAHAYMAATARNLGLANVHIGGVEDHVHMIAGFDPAKSISSIVGKLKQSSTVWIRERHQPRFRWQRGFAAFSVSPQRLAAGIRYVERQEEHHRKRTLAEELDELLREFGLTSGDLGLL